ncbi:MAG: hypothetical protein ACLVDP_01185 [Flavonifractor plautii]
MEKTILTDAPGSCPSLKGLVSEVLRANTYIRWELVSASCEGESCRAEFVSPAGEPGLVFCLAAEVGPPGFRSHISIRCPDDVDALNKLSV